MFFGQVLMVKLIFPEFVFMLPHYVTSFSGCCTSCCVGVLSIGLNPLDWDLVSLCLVVFFVFVFAFKSVMCTLIHVFSGMV